MAKRKVGKRSAPVKTELLSPDAYGKTRGVSRQAVMKAIQSGRLGSAAVKEGRKWVIDRAKADAAWDSASNPSQQREASAGGAPRRRDGTGDLFESTRGGARSHEDVASSEPRSSAPSGESHASASARHTRVKAAIAELDYRERLGKLVDRDAIGRELFDIGRAIRDSLQRVADRCAGLAAAENSERKVHALLTKEHHEALASLDAFLREDSSR